MGDSIEQFCSAAAVSDVQGAFVTIDNPVTQRSDLARVEAIAVTSTFSSPAIDSRSLDTEMAIASNDSATRTSARDALLNLRANLTVVALIEPPGEGLIVRNLPHVSAGSISKITTGKPQCYAPTEGAFGFLILSHKK
ncbi:MAG: hypothetical protein K8F62_16415 [Pseudorhodoplanes sp.]|nr:hypothetical protein [Pseudorhodoplanes sp.]